MFQRKVILIIFFFLITSAELFAQQIIDSIKVCGLPVREGTIYVYDPLRGRCIRQQQVASIITKCDSVFHLTEGQVAAVLYFGDDENCGYAIIIRNENDEYVAYSNLKFASLKRGDSVKKGTWLGLAGISEKGSSRQVDFMLFKNAEKVSFKNESEYIRCGNYCVEQTGYTL